MRSAAALAVAALAAAALAACGGHGDKAGGGGGVTTLDIASPDPHGRANTRAAEFFAREVRRRSHGRIRVRVVYEASIDETGSAGPAWDQRVARQVRDGRHTFGMVPARAWDDLGVRTLAPLQTPFLITSRELAQRVVRGPLAHDLLAGLERAGVVGLGLVVEGRRHPVGFRGPLLGPRDYRGAVMRSPRSRQSYVLLRALGARPVDDAGPSLARAIATGRVTGAESELALLGTLPVRGWVTTNVTFFTKVDALVIGKRAFTRLDGDERSVLRAAAAATSEQAFRAGPDEADAAAKACARGSSLAWADARDVQALRRRAAPVVARLEADPATGALVRAIEALARRGPATDPEPPACDQALPAAAPVPVARGTADPSALDGVYRYRMSERELLDAGVDAEGAAVNHGVITNVLRDGRFSSRATDNGLDDPPCVGTYTLDASGRVDVFVPDCDGHFAMHVRRLGADLEMDDVRSLAPYDSDGGAVDRALWGTKRWRRIASVPRRRPGRIRDGRYVTRVSELALLRTGATAEAAAAAAGARTLVIDGLRFRLQLTGDTGVTNCPGQLIYAGARAFFDADRARGCGDAAGGNLFSGAWAASEGGLRFSVLDGDEAAMALAGGPWRRAG